MEIPFAEALAHKLPLSHFRVMRDFPQVLSLIRAHALMHSCTRERGEGGEVIATLDDYRAVYEIIAAPLAQGLEEAVPEAIRAVVNKVKELQKLTSVDIGWDDQAVSQVQLAEALGRDQPGLSTLPLRHGRDLPPQAIR